MVKQEEIQNYINSIPPSPGTLKKVLSFIQDGELIKAASATSDDPALKAYLKNIVNKPIYGFRNEIKDLGQVFGILGLTQTEQTIYNYMVLLLAPKKWELFKLTNKEFAQIQDQLGFMWKKILEHKGIKDKSIYSAISLLPASIIVCEALFKSKQDDINLLRGVKDIDYNTILQRLSGMDLYELCTKIAQVWEMPEIVSRLVLCSKGDSDEKDENIIELSKWMHLLFFYQLSQPTAVAAGLNDFIEFNIEYVQDIYEEFQNLIMEES